MTFDELVVNDGIILHSPRKGDHTYTVAARNERYIILSNLLPENNRYRIIDLEKNEIALKDHCIFKLDYSTKEGCERNLQSLIEKRINPHPYFREYLSDVSFSYA